MAQSWLGNYIFSYIMHQKVFPNKTTFILQNFNIEVNTLFYTEKKKIMIGITYLFCVKNENLQ